jgi:hypothetical protein
MKTSKEITNDKRKLIKKQIELQMALLPTLGIPKMKLDTLMLEYQGEELAAKLWALHMRTIKKGTT